VETHVLLDLVNHELRVSPDVEAFDSRLNDNSKAAEKGLLFCHVVGHGEMQAYRVPHMLHEG
jgi:hypothetical protein